jgi:MOSC domain-containing protein YiiM
MVVTHRTRQELEAGLEHVRESPRDAGVVQMIVRRPRAGERETLDAGELDTEDGLVGDSWKHRPGSRRLGGGPDPATQINVMNARVAALVAGDPSQWPLAGDQLLVDLDLSRANLPPGTRLRIGSAVIEVSEKPHIGCGKFVNRFGVDAMKFVNSPLGRELCLRGINARVIRAGSVRVGDVVRKNP